MLLIVWQLWDLCSSLAGVRECESVSGLYVWVPLQGTGLYRLCSIWPLLLFTHTQINKHWHAHSQHMHHLASQLWATDVAVPAPCQAAGAGCMAWLVLLRNSSPPPHFFLLLQACLGLLLPVCSALMMFVSSPPSGAPFLSTHFLHLQLLHLSDHPHHRSVSKFPSSAPLINSHPSFTTLVLPSQLLLFFLLLHPFVNHFLSFCSAHHPTLHHLSCFWALALALIPLFSSLLWLFYRFTGSLCADLQ